MFKNLNEFQKVLLNILLVLLGFLVHSLIWRCATWYLGVNDSIYGGDAHSQPFWFVCLTSNLFGVFFDLVIGCITAIIYGFIIRPLIVAYRKSYKTPKQHKKDLKLLEEYKIERYKNNLIT